MSAAPNIRTRLCDWGQGLCTCPECLHWDGADAELEEVLVFLRRHERDQVLGITPPSLTDIIAALQREEHRR